MTVKINKPAVNLREELNELKKPTGVAGEAMLRAETPQEQFNLIGAGRRNLIINGDNQISQRGTVTGISTAENTYGGPDRRTLYSNSNGAVFTISQGTSGPSEFSNTARIDCTTASSALTLNQEIKTENAIEGFDVIRVGFGTSSAKPLTVSFWVKSNQAADFVLWFYRPDGGRHTSLTYTITAADTWEYKTVTIQPDSSDPVTIDNTTGLYASFIINSGPGYKSGTSPNGNWEDIVTANRYVGQTATIGNSTDDYFEWTGLQIETGKVATPFEHRSYGEELALCQRYYTVAHWYHGIQAGEMYATTYHPVELRSPPTVSQSVTGGYTGSYNIHFNTTRSFAQWQSATSPYFSTRILTFDAEL